MATGLGEVKLVKLHSKIDPGEYIYDCSHCFHALQSGIYKINNIIFYFFDYFFLYFDYSPFF